jgi:hypothetical protein
VTPADLSVLISGAARTVLTDHGFDPAVVDGFRKMAYIFLLLVILKR